MGDQTATAARVAATLTLDLLLWAPPAQADIIRGVQEIVAGVVQVPLSTIAGTFSGPPVVGTVFGALQGTINGVGLVTHGALELLASAVPIAKAIAPFLLPFLF